MHYLSNQYWTRSIGLWLWLGYRHAWNVEALGIHQDLLQQLRLDGRNWSFDNFGEDLIATVHKGGTFRWDTSSGCKQQGLTVIYTGSYNFYDLILVSMPDRHVFLFGTETTIGDSFYAEMIYFYDSHHKRILRTWTPTLQTNTSGSFRIQDGSKDSSCS